MRLAAVAIASPGTTPHPVGGVSSGVLSGCGWWWCNRAILDERVSLPPPNRRLQPPLRHRRLRRRHLPQPHVQHHPPTLPQAPSRRAQRRLPPNPRHLHPPTPTPQIYRRQIPHPQTTHQHPHPQPPTKPLRHPLAINQARRRPSRIRKPNHQRSQTPTSRTASLKSKHCNRHSHHQGQKVTHQSIKQVAQPARI